MLAGKDVEQIMTKRIIYETIDAQTEKNCNREPHWNDQQKMHSTVVISKDPLKYYRVIALILVNIVPSWDIEGRELARVLRFPNEGQYSPISV